MIHRCKILFGMIMLLFCMVMTGCRSQASGFYSDGLRLYEMGNYTEAEKMFLQATAKDNTNADYFTALGMNYIEMGEYQKAEDAFSSSISLKKEQQLAYRGQGINYLAQGKYDEAVSSFKQAIEYTGSMVGKLDYDILAYRGQAELKGGFYKEAVDTYTALIELDYMTKDMYFYRGQVYLRQGDTEKALQDFQACTQLATGDILIHFEIYQLLSDAGLADNGIAYLNAILNIKDDTDEGHLNRGKVYYVLKRYENAMTELQFAMEHDVPEAFLYMGLCYEALDDYRNAKELYVTYLREHNQINEFTQSIYAQYAYVQTKLGEYVFAQQIIEQALNLGESDIYDDLLWNEIMIYIRLEDYVTAYDKALSYKEKYPTDTEIDAELAYIQMRLP